MVQSNTTTIIRQTMLCFSVNYVFQTYVFVTTIDIAMCTRRLLNRVKISSYFSLSCSHDGRLESHLWQVFSLDK